MHTYICTQYIHIHTHMYIQKEASWCFVEYQEMSFYRHLDDVNKWASTSEKFLIKPPGAS